MKGDNKRDIVMIADDDLFIRKIITSALSDLADIIEVTDGSEVVEKYNEYNPDIVFLDIHLPNINGLDLISSLMQCDENACIVMVSADSSEENVRNAKIKGIKCFLTKPFTKDRVLHLFNNCPTISRLDEKELNKPII